MHQISFYRAEHQLHNIWTYYFDPPLGYSYLAGQYAEFSLPHTSPDERGNRRTFTISSEPTESKLAITLDFPDRPSSFKRALQKLKPGKTIFLGEPMGDLILPIDDLRPLVFIAGGLSMASYRAMLQSTSGQQRDITLHYAVRKPDQLLFQDVINNSPAKPYYYHSGKRLTAEAIANLARPNSLFYISGSERFVDYIRSGLASQKIDSHQIVFDYFDGYTDL